MFKKLILSSFISASCLYSSTISLNSGWNLTGAMGDMNISTLLTQVGSENLLVISSDGQGAYNKAWGGGSFTNFNPGSGYWIKVETDVNATYTPSTSVSVVELSSGWNLVSPLSDDMNITTLLTQAGSENLLVISSDGQGAYNKAWGGGSFEKFNIGHGYWLKVSEDVNITFSSTSIEQPPETPSLDDNETTELSAPPSVPSI